MDDRSDSPTPTSEVIHKMCAPTDRSCRQSDELLLSATPTTTSRFSTSSPHRGDALSRHGWSNAKHHATRGNERQSRRRGRGGGVPQSLRSYIPRQRQSRAQGLTSPVSTGNAPAAAASRTAGPVSLSTDRARRKGESGQVPGRTLRRFVTGELGRMELTIDLARTIRTGPENQDPIVYGLLPHSGHGSRVRPIGYPQCMQHECPRLHTRAHTVRTTRDPNKSTVIAMTHTPKPRHATLTGRTPSVGDVLTRFRIDIPEAIFDIDAIRSLHSHI
jgi:hypothetical protein